MSKHNPENIHYIQTVQKKKIYPCGEKILRENITVTIWNAILLCSQSVQMWRLVSQSVTC